LCIPKMPLYDEAFTPVPPLDVGSVPVVSESAMPREEVANWSIVFPAPPIKREEEAMEESPVPPPGTVSVPVTVGGAKVKVPPVLVMAFSKERPLKEVADDVASVRSPVSAVPYVCARDVTKFVEVAIAYDAPLWPRPRRPFVSAVKTGAFVKVCVPSQVLLVVVPKARVTVFAEFTRGYVKERFWMDEVAVQVGMPFSHARTCPPVPCEVVERALAPLP
jgi:hypothetical protein